MTEDQPPAFRLLPDSDEERAASPSEQPPRPRRLGPRQRLAGLVVVVLLVAGGIGLQLHRSNKAIRRQVQAVSAPVPAPLPQPVVGPWPSTSGSCGTDVLLPIIATNPLTEPIPLRLAVGGYGLHQVDLTDSSVTDLPDADLPSGTFVLNRQTAGPVTYLETQSCDKQEVQLYRLAPGHRPQLLIISGGLATAGLFPDGTGGVWTTRIGPAQDLSDGIIAFTLVRLDRTEVINLPVNLTPVALHGNRLVAKSNDNRSPETTVSLVVLDLKSLRVTTRLGPVTSITQSQGKVLWTPRACSATSQCELDTYDLDSGTVADSGYGLPLEAQVTGGVLSPDLHQLAFELPRMFDDTRYQATAAGTPGDLVVLNLRTGVLEPIPNLELPPTAVQAPVSLTFSRDGKWLIISIAGPGGPRLLAWRPGLDHPLDTNVLLAGPPPDPFPALIQPLPAG